MSKNYEYKSKCVEQLVTQNSTKKHNATDNIKDFSAINLLDILKNAQENEIAAICADLNSGKINVAMDADAVNYIWANQENENVKKILSSTKTKINLDLNSIAELEKYKDEDGKIKLGTAEQLGSKKIQKIRELGINLDKVYVNDGYDKAAAVGYKADTFSSIINKAERKVNHALSKLPQNASEAERYHAIYESVVTGAHYDYSALKDNSKTEYTARNLEGYFEDGTSVCAGTALVLKELCDMNGIEAEYVQGDSDGRTGNEYHAWVRAKIDGKWCNSDPTWEGNRKLPKVGKNTKMMYERVNDKDFKGHYLDRNYRPTYVRNSNGQRVKGVYREYEKAVDRTRRVDITDIDNFNNRLKYNRELTEEEIEYIKKCNENRVPIGVATPGTQSGISSIFTMVLNFLIRITSWPAKVRDKAKQRLSKNSLSQGSDLSKLSSKEEQDKYFKDLRAMAEKDAMEEEAVAQSQKTNNKSQNNNKEQNNIIDGR